MHTRPDAKIMFEIYRDGGVRGPFRVVYFTELDGHDKDDGIARAMEGEHVFDGFIPEGTAAESKAQIASLLERLNRGESFDAPEIEAQLSGALV